MISKKRALLRAQSNRIETSVIIGKSGVGEKLIEQVKNAVNANELIKCKVLETAMMSASDAADLIAGEVNAEVVCTIGRTIVLYKKKNKPKNKKPLKIKTKVMPQRLRHDKKVKVRVFKPRAARAKK